MCKLTIKKERDKEIYGSSVIGFYAILVNRNIFSTGARVFA